MSVTTTNPTCAGVVAAVADIVTSSELNVLIETCSDEEKQVVLFQIRGSPDDGAYIADFIARQAPDGATISQPTAYGTQVQTHLSVK